MKICIRCAEIKPHGDFYRHAEMRDGRLNVCKECVKKRVKKRNKTNPAVQVYERKRSKLPARRDHLRRNAESWKRRYPQAYKAHNALNNAVRNGKITKGPCFICGTDSNIHGHHSNYAEPLSVVWLCAKCHTRIHAAFPQLRGQKDTDQCRS
jgi:hypothetical protein